MHPMLNQPSIPFSLLEPKWYVSNTYRIPGKGTTYHKSKIPYLLYSIAPLKLDSALDAFGTKDHRKTFHLLESLMLQLYKNASFFFVIFSIKSHSQL